MELNMLKYVLDRVDRNMRNEIVDHFTPTWCIDRPKPMYENAPFNPWGYTFSDVEVISNYILNAMEKDMGVDIKWYRQHPEHYKESLFREWLMGKQNIFNTDFTRDANVLCEMCSRLTDLPKETFADYISHHAVDLVYDMIELLFKALLKYDAKYYEENHPDEEDDYDEDDDEDDDEEDDGEEEDDEDNMEEDAFESDDFFTALSSDAIDDENDIDF